MDRKCECCKHSDTQARVAIDAQIGDLAPSKEDIYTELFVCTECAKVALDYIKNELPEVRSKQLSLEGGL